MSLTTNKMCIYARRSTTLLVVVLDAQIATLAGAVRIVFAGNLILSVFQFPFKPNISWGLIVKILGIIVLYSDAMGFNLSAHWSVVICKM